MSKLTEQLNASAAYLKDRGVEPATIGLVLGSGLGAFGDVIEEPLIIPYGDIPGFPTSAVAGHKGQFVYGRCGGVPVYVFQGRVHAYEGWRWEEVVYPVRTLATIGVNKVVLTNAAGGLNPNFEPGTLMRITDHLNLTGGNPLTGKNHDELGPRFPDMTDAYDPTLGAALDEAARATGVRLAKGVYAGLFGPSYETPAEIRMLRTVGADAVGMSTVAECIALRHMGVHVTGISCITNLAAGISPHALSHDEVKETADRVAQEFIALLEEAVVRLHEAHP